MIYSTSCVGKLCNFDYRCASRESCCSDGKCTASCVGTSCDGKSDCRSGEICWDLAKNSVGTCIKSCIGKSSGITPWDRIFERTCASGERYCLFSKRRGVNCIGEAGTSNSHCAMGETCCDRPMVQVNVPLLVLENRVKNMVHPAQLLNIAVALVGPVG